MEKFFNAKALGIMLLGGIILFHNDIRAQINSSDTLEQFFLTQLKNHRSMAYANYVLATIYFNRGDYKRSITYAKENLKTPNEFDTACTVLYCRALEMTGRYNKAERIFRSSVRRYEGSALLWFSYGFFLYKLRKYSQAENALENSLRLNPYMPSAHYLIGYSMLENKQIGGSVQAFLFGLMTDNDTLRSLAILYNIQHYALKEYDSIPIPFFQDRLSLKFPEQVFLFKKNNQALTRLVNNFSPSTISSILSQELEKEIQPSIYRRFYEALINQNLLEPYCYFAFRNITKPELKSWYRVNKNKMEKLAGFLDEYLSKPF
ncbi:MAG: tetratricopeptide repeat protein [Bacteroidales bacterium]|nr:tetratricopeptide repeat protein [Bacteroidales bacterium]